MHRSPRRFAGGWLAFFLLCSLSLPAGSGDGILVRQQIRYQCEDAREVYLVWGINSWRIPDSGFWPEGSFIRDKRVYTAMRQVEGGFAADILLPHGTMTDYAFRITQGPGGTGADVWDRNVSPLTDYHTYAGHHQTVVVNPAAEIIPFEQISVLHFPISFFILVTAFCIIGWAMAKACGVSSGRGPAEPGLVIMATGTVLVFLLLMIRPSVSGMAWEIYSWKPGILRHWLVSGYYDVIFALGLTAAFFMAHLAIGRRIWAQWLSVAVFAAVSLFTVLCAVMNIHAVQFLDKPLDYQWLYFSGILNDPGELAGAVPAGPGVHGVIMLCGAGLVLACLLARLLHAVALTELRRKTVYAVFPGIAIVYLGIATRMPEREALSYDKVANPVVSLIASLNPFSGLPPLCTMKVHDSLLVGDSDPAEEFMARTPRPNGVRNVLVFMMSSTPAEYLEVYGSKFKVTPELSKWSRQAMVFNNVYAPAPSDDVSLVSLLGSISQGPDRRHIAGSHPRLNIETLSSWLDARGFRCGFFSSADNSWGNTGDFLEGRGFGRISDRSDGHCAGEVSEGSANEHMNGREERCTAAELSSWIAADRSQPFFGVMWTYQTHYPYFVNGREKSYCPDPELNRYLNALRCTDEAFGNVMSRLKKLRMLDSTLVVVVSDHGAAFGRHGQAAQERNLYEENVHVPCLLIHPSLGRQQNANIGGLVDLAPTITDLLGFDTPQEWQGQSLFAANRSGRAYFIDPGSGLLGYRERDAKYIYDAETGNTEIYDLKSDPAEEENLARLLPEEVSLCHQRLAAWVQHVNRDLLSRMARQNILGPAAGVGLTGTARPGSDAGRGQKRVAAKLPHQLKHVIAAAPVLPVMPYR
jgi:lipoteichoic acid synthase